MKGLGVVAFVDQMVEMLGRTLPLSVNVRVSDRGERERRDVIVSWARWAVSSVSMLSFALLCEK